MTEPYGSVRFYADLFNDIIADAHPDDTATGDNIIEGFRLALKEWRGIMKMELKKLKNRS